MWSSALFNMLYKRTRRIRKTKKILWYDMVQYSKNENSICNISIHLKQAESLIMGKTQLTDLLLVPLFPINVTIMLISNIHAPQEVLCQSKPPLWCHYEFAMVLCLLLPNPNSIFFILENISKAIMLFLLSFQ